MGVVAFMPIRGKNREETRDWITSICRNKVMPGDIVAFLRVRVPVDKDTV